jgi:hypothetical protein
MKRLLVICCCVLAGACDSTAKRELAARKSDLRQLLAEVQLSAQDSPLDWRALSEICRKLQTFTIANPSVEASGVRSVIVRLEALTVFNQVAPLYGNTARPLRI